MEQASQGRQTESNAQEHQSPSAGGVRDRFDGIRPERIMKGCPRQGGEWRKTEQKHRRFDPPHLDVAREVHISLPSIPWIVGGTVG
jgi:hypothetical protein